MEESRSGVEGGPELSREEQRAEGDLEHDRIDVMAVHDDAAPAVCIIESCTYGTGFAPGQL